MVQPVFQKIDTVYAFSVYDEHHNLIYSKYNFNFDKYLTDNSSELSSTSTKSQIFYHFLMKNNTDLNKPFSVKNELINYFLQMTPEIINYHEHYGYCASLNYMQSVDPLDVANSNTIFNNQFELVEYSNDALRRLQDYIYYENFLTFYTKYNFDFNTYKLDFNVWGTSKLSVFTDFVFRTQYLNNSIIGAYGYGSPIDSFKKYFIQTYPNFEKYLLTYSVTSIYQRVYNSYPNIIWTEYGLNNPNLSKLNVPELQEQFISYGQFEQLIVTFNQPINKDINNKINSLVTITTSSDEGTGFLYTGSSLNIVNGKIQAYVVTAYHLISDSLNKNSFFGTVNYFDPIANKQINNKLQFKVIGFDIFSDILVGLYDPKLDYNIQFNSDLNVESMPTIDIDGTYYPLKNDEVFTIGNIGEIDTNVIIQGKIMNNKYRGDYSSTFVLGIPEAYLINFYIEGGMSGSPIYHPGSNHCIGMIVGVLGNNSQYTVATSGFYLSAVAFNAVSRWYTYGPLYDLTNITTLNFFIKDSFPKK